MIPKSHHQRARQVLADAIAVLCQNIIPHSDQLNVEGLLGITVDNREVLLVNIQQSIQKDDDDCGSDHESVLRIDTCLGSKLEHHKGSHYKGKTSPKGYPDSHHISHRLSTGSCCSYHRAAEDRGSSTSTSSRCSDDFGRFSPRKSHEKLLMVSPSSSDLAATRGADTRSPSDTASSVMSGQMPVHKHEHVSTCCHSDHSLPNEGDSKSTEDAKTDLVELPSPVAHKKQNTHCHDNEDKSADKPHSHSKSKVDETSDGATKTCLSTPTLHNGGSLRRKECHIDDASTILKEVYLTYNNISPAVPMATAEDKNKETSPSEDQKEDILAQGVMIAQVDRDAEEEGRDTAGGMRLPLVMALKTEDPPDDQVVVIQPEPPASPCPEEEDGDTSDSSDTPAIINKPYSIAGKLTGSLKRKANMVPMHLVKQRRHLLEEDTDEEGSDEGPVERRNRRTKEGEGLSMNEGMLFRISDLVSMRNGSGAAGVSPLEIDLTVDEDSSASEQHLTKSSHISVNGASRAQHPAENLLLPDYHKPSEPSSESSGDVEHRKSLDAAAEASAQARKSLHDHIRHLQEKQRRTSAEAETVTSPSGNQGNQGNIVQTVGSLRAQIENQMCLLTRQQLVHAMPSALQEGQVVSLRGASQADALQSAQLAALQARALGSATTLSSRDLAMFQQAHLFSSALQTLSQLTGNENIAQSQAASQMLALPDQAGRANFQCRTCGKQMASQQGLLIHYRTHTGEKPHVCTFCGKGLSTSQGLQVHVRTHTGEKPFMCLFCGKGFNDKSNMKRHIKQCNTYGQRINSLT